MSNDKKDLNAILASLDPKLRDKIELPQTEKKADVQPMEQAPPVSVSVQEAPVDIPEPEENEPPKSELQKAEENAAAILSFEGSSKEGVKHKSGAAYLAIELLVLEIIAFILFFATYRSESFGGFGLIAMLMPIIVGILMRMFKDQLSLKEAVSKCKFHIILSCFFLVCIMLSA